MKSTILVAFLCLFFLYGEISCVSQELIDEIRKIFQTMHDPIGNKPRGQGTFVMSQGIKQFYELTPLESFSQVLNARGIVSNIINYFEGIAFSNSVFFKAFILHLDNGQGQIDIYYGVAHKQTLGEFMKNSPSFINDQNNQKWSKPVVEWSLALLTSKICVEHMDRLWYSCPYKTSFTQQEKPAYVDRMKYKSTQDFLEARAFSVTNIAIDPSLN
jgi:hypothetical protein